MSWRRRHWIRPHRRRWSLSLRCLFRGHDFMLRNAFGRRYLWCVRCGKETPGWDVITGGRGQGRSGGGTAA